jgi:hypothetical protein
MQVVAIDDPGDEEQRATDDGLTEAEVLASLGGMTPQEALAVRMKGLTAWADNFSITVDGQGYQLNASEQVAYDGNDLSRALREQAGKVAWWGALTAKLARTLNEAKGQAEHIRARVAVDIRGGARPAPGGKITEGSVKEAVEVDMAVLAAEAYVMEAQEKVDTAKAVVEALRHRKEMLYLEGLLANTEMRSVGLAIRGK